MRLDLAIVGDRVQHPDRVLEPVPARDLGDQGRVGWHGAVLVKLGGTTDARAAPVESVEESATEVIPLLDAGNVQDGGDRIRLEVLVLRGERVDRRRDDPDSCGLNAVPDERLPGEDVCVRLGHIRVEEFPGLVRELPWPVHPDVAAPDRADVLVLEVGEEPRRLRIVDVYDVPWPNELEQLAGGLGQRVLVDPALLGTQAPSVSGGLVQVVVEALREAEELGVPGDGQPAHIDAGAAGIGEQRLEQLGDPASLRRRVDMPDHPAAEDLPGGGDCIFDLLVSIAEQRPEALRRHCGDGYLLQCVHQARPYYRALGRI